MPLPAEAGTSCEPHLMHVTFMDIRRHERPGFTVTGSGSRSAQRAQPVRIAHGARTHAVRASLWPEKMQVQAWIAAVGVNGAVARDCCTVGILRRGPLPPKVGAQRMSMAGPLAACSVESA